MTSERDIWFPAKRYGLGWGLPVAWQGWLVLVVYAAGLPIIVSWLPPSIEAIDFGIAVVLWTALLLVFCRIKGERIRWRWDNDLR